jgi:hypothetical protein
MGVSSDAYDGVGLGCRSVTECRSLYDKTPTGSKRESLRSDISSNPPGSQRLRKKEEGKVGKGGRGRKLNILNARGKEMQFAEPHFTALSLLSFPQPFKCKWAAARARRRKRSSRLSITRRVRPFLLSFSFFIDGFSRRYFPSTARQSPQSGARQAAPSCGSHYGWQCSGGAGACSCNRNGDGTRCSQGSSACVCASTHCWPGARRRSSTKGSCSCCARHGC